MERERESFSPLERFFVWAMVSLGSLELGRQAVVSLAHLGLALADASPPFWVPAYLRPIWAQVLFALG